VGDRRHCDAGDRCPLSVEDSVASENLEDRFDQRVVPQPRHNFRRLIARRDRLGRDFGRQCNVSVATNVIEVTTLLTQPGQRP
jgi:hypothetical protein